MAWKLRQKMKQWHVLILALWVIAWLTVHLWPASYFLEVRQVQVFDAEEGQPVRMVVDRTIHRPFYADWNVRVRQAGNNNTWLTACASSGGGDYVRGATLPITIDLSWWTDGRCQTLPQGQYIVSTTWRLLGGAFLPDKVVRHDSNIFRVGELPPPIAD